MILKYICFFRKKV